MLRVQINGKETRSMLKIHSVGHLYASEAWTELTIVRPQNWCDHTEATDHTHMTHPLIQSKSFDLFQNKLY